MPESVVKQVKIMISSTRADLAQYREEASKIMKRVAAEKETRVQLVEVSMEKETQSGDREFAVAVSKHWVEESDWVVLIVGWNYGTISDEVGADGLSVTEWEYRHTLALIDKERNKEKKLFVFIAGDPETTNEYRCSNEEKVDLKNWVFKQTEEQKKKLEKFRQELGRRHADMFANLHMFRERLEKTLKDAIDILPPEIQPGTPLAEVILSVKRDIEDCIRRVTLIASCKEIHDCLHEILQNVIRPLRDEVLSVWEQDETLSKARVNVIIGCVNEAAEQRGTIKGVRKSIGSQHQLLRDGVDKVLDEVQRWIDWMKGLDLTEGLLSVRSWPTRGRFAENVDNLAGLVEFTFSEADESIWKEESELRDRYSALKKGLERARGQRNLSPLDHQRLDDELDKVESNRERMKNVLATHHSWQDVHNKLYQLDLMRGTSRFENELKRYCDTGLLKLFALADEELGETHPYRVVTGETDQGGVAPVVRQGLTLLPTAPDGCSAFVDDLRRLKESLEELCRGDGTVAFDKIRKPFEDGFYYVDKRTLEEVKGAQKCVDVLGKWLDDLATGRRKAQ